MRTYYKSGCWNVDCQVCGFEFKSDEIKKRWDGLMVCQYDFEQRHPMDFLRTRGDHTSVPYVHQDVEVFITVPYIDTGD